MINKHYVIFLSLLMKKSGHFVHQILKIYVIMSLSHSAVQMTVTSRILNANQ